MYIGFLVLACKHQSGLKVYIFSTSISSINLYTYTIFIWTVHIKIYFLAKLGDAGMKNVKWYQSNFKDCIYSSNLSGV